MFPLLSFTSPLNLTRQLVQEPPLITKSFSVSLLSTPIPPAPSPSHNPQISKIPDAPTFDPKISRPHISIENNPFVNIPDDDENRKTYFQHFSSLLVEYPMIAIGLLVTVGALGRGIRAMVQGDRHTSQMMMRWRIAGQSFVVATLVGATLYRSNYFNQSNQDSIEPDSIIDPISKNPKTEPTLKQEPQ